MNLLWNHFAFLLSSAEKSVRLMIGVSLSPVSPVLLRLLFLVLSSLPPDLYLCFCLYGLGHLLWHVHGARFSSLSQTFSQKVV